MLNKLSMAVVGIAMMLMVACGGGGGNETAAEKPAAKASSDITEIIIEPVGNEMKYAQTEFTVKAGSKVRLIMKNTATLDAMVHNVVIMKPGSDGTAVGMAALQAGEAKEYIPEDAAIMFYTPLAKPGETTQVEFTAPPAGDYPYICTFPGHFSLMKGVMKSVD